MISSRRSCSKSTSISGGSPRSLEMKRSNSMAARSRIDFGDAQREADRGIGRRTAPLAQNADFAGMADDVVDRQEIGFVFQVGNQGQFMLDALPDIVGNALPDSAPPGRARFRGAARRLACARPARSSSGYS